jgi:hypothetical protein
MLTSAWKRASGAGGQLARWPNWWAMETPRTVWKTGKARVFQLFCQIGGKQEEPRFQDHKQSFHADPTRIERGSYLKELTDRLEKHRSVVLYGPPGQGKTLLVNRILEQADTIYIECRPKFRRTQIYRLILSSIGYGITIEKKKKTKKTYKLSLGISKNSLSGDLDAELETRAEPVSVDLKNASEVAYLVSRLPGLPVVVFNGFHRLNRPTQEHLLYDIAFFIERTNLSFVIVGSWPNADYLEVIQPAIMDKFDYIFVPYWTEHELRSAYQMWHERGLARPVPPEQLDQILQSAGGDISLFYAIATKMPVPSNSDFSSSVDNFVVTRSKSLLETNIAQLRKRREFVFTYDRILVRYRRVPNKAFRPIPGFHNDDYHKIILSEPPDDDTRRGHDNLVNIDAEGNPQFILQAEASIERVRAEFDPLVLALLYKAAQANDKYVELSELAKELAEQIDQPTNIDQDKVESLLLDMDEAQRRASISPALISFDYTNNTLSIADRRFFLTLRSLNPDDFVDMIERTTPAVRVPRRKAHVSPDLSQDEIDSLKAEAVRKSGGEITTRTAGAEGTVGYGTEDDDENADGYETGDDEDTTH